MPAPAPDNIVGLARQVAAALTAKDAGGSPFSKRVTVKYVLAPEYKAKDIADKVRVSVVPRGLDGELVARDAHQDDFRVDVGVQALVTESDEAQLDALLGLVNEIRLWLRDQAVATAGLTCTPIKTENDPLFYYGRLKKGIFTSVLSLTYRVLD